MKYQTLSIIAVVASMSKPYGLFYSRIGFAFSRHPMLTLYPNIWFKNIFSIHVAQLILDSIKFGSLYTKYLPIQTRAISQLVSENSIVSYPSDVLLLSYIPTNKSKNLPNPNIKPYLRGNNYRFCLTPYFLNSQNY